MIPVGEEAWLQFASAAGRVSGREEAVFCFFFLLRSEEKNPTFISPLAFFFSQTQSLVKKEKEKNNGVCLLPLPLGALHCEALRCLAAGEELTFSLVHH